MWHWDQGRLAYFDFDALRAVSQFALNHDLKTASRAQLEAATGFPFWPSDYVPWRNYSRVFKSCLLVSEHQGVAVPSAVAAILAHVGAVTSDEYFHFLAEASTEPNPALNGWLPHAAFRYPLLVVLKYLLAKCAVSADPSASVRELIGMYEATGFVGDEDDTAFIAAVQGSAGFEQVGAQAPSTIGRQAAESIKVLCQISYLNVRAGRVNIDLNSKDAQNVFNDLSPVAGLRATTSDAEIVRIAQLFSAGSTHDFFDYPNTVINDVVESGFVEGGKVAKTHVTIERNTALRKAFFAAHPTTICDVCALDTKATYPWTERVMDLHHLLPLCSGTRVVGQNTTFLDLVPLCPTCHRAVHRYYGRWFNDNGQADFAGRDEAISVYGLVKQNFLGLIHA